jgi:hypothetical protein
MYIDRMIGLIEDICASSKLSKAEKSEALGEVVILVLSEGEVEGIEHGDSNANLHEARLQSEEKNKTIVVRKELMESAQRLNKILHKTGIKWDGSEVKPKDIQLLQDELDRRGIVVPKAATRKDDQTLLHRDASAV